MSSLLNVIWITILEQFKINKIFSNKNILVKVIVGLLAIIIIASFGAMIGLMYYGVAVMTFDYYGIEIVVSLALISGSMILLITTISKANSFLFRAKDFDFLASTPIPTRNIVSAKILAFIISNYFIFLLAYAPMIVVYAMFMQTSVTFYLLALVIFIFMPLLLIAVFSFLSYILASVLSRFRYKNLIAIIGYSVLIIGVLLVNFQTSSGEQNADVFISMNDKLKFIYYPAFFAKEAILGNNTRINILIFFALNVIPFMIFIFITGRIFVKINTTLGRNAASRKMVESDFQSKQTGMIKELFIMETKRFFSIPIYVVNAGLIKVMGPIMIIMMRSQMKDIVSSVDQDVVVLLMAAVLVFTVGITSTTSSAISIEGKSFWIIKSSPIEPKQVFIAKILLDVVLSAIGGVISIILLAVLYNVDLANLMLITLLYAAMALQNAVLGLVVNLRFPKLDWDLPVRAIKQSASVFVNMIIGFLITIILVVIGYFTIELLGSILLVYLFTSLTLLLILASEVWLLLRFGTKWYNKIKV
ncbi:MAG: hypothetical protein RBQ97_04125 [Acholeplasma sp.]|nr:hypothetical protein [Acholeplasma sp.]